MHKWQFLLIISVLDAEIEGYNHLYQMLLSSVQISVLLKYYAFLCENR